MPGRPSPLFSSLALIAGFAFLNAACSRSEAQGENPTLAAQAPAASAAPVPVAAPPAGGDACPLLTLEQQRYPGATVKSAREYGLKGDGVTDEYTAFHKIAAGISNNRFSRRMIVYFPAGTYYIDRFVRENGVGANTNRHVKYANASNFSLIGCTGAIISIKGDFKVTNDTTLGTKSWYTYTQQLDPFVMESSSNFRVSGFEINGNVDKMTRDTPADGKGIAEPDSFGMLTSAASNYEVSHMKIHHFSSDGILVGADRKADDGGLFDDIEVYNNARQGVSVIQAINLKFTNSTFRDTGYTQGAYPAHAPSAGVDIEPNWTPANGASAKTGNIVFEHCHFKNNRASQFVTAGNGATVENVRISHSEIIGKAGGFPYVIIMSVPGGIIENSYIDTATGGIYPFFSDDIGSVQSVNTIVRGNTIVSSGAGLLAADMDAKVVVENNTFVSRHDPGYKEYFPYITQGVVRFTGNKINYDTKNFGKKSVVSLIRVPEFRDNTLTTNRADGKPYIVAVSAASRRTDNTISDRIQIRP